MILNWKSLNRDERNSVQAAKAYLKSRLSQSATVDWALRLTPSRRAERFAIIELLDGHPVIPLENPYAAAWRLIQESWLGPSTEKSDSLAVHDIRRRLQAGECSGVLIDEFSNLVARKLEVKPLDDRPGLPIRRKPVPDSVEDLLAASLTSMSLRKVFGRSSADVGLSDVSSLSFLVCLAITLMGKVDGGLFIAHRIYGDKRHWGPPAIPARVYFVYPSNAEREEKLDPDDFNRGLAPSVKFLHKTVTRIGELEPSSVTPFLCFFRHSTSDVYRRLWAAFARDTKMDAAQDVGEFLCDATNAEFWDLVSFPEIAELRAVRFAGFDERARYAVIQRLEDGPPRDLWRMELKNSEVEDYQRHFRARELRRIELSGGELPSRAQESLRVASGQYAGLANMAIDEGFRGKAGRRVQHPVQIWHGGIEFVNFNALRTRRADWECPAPQDAV